MDNRFWLDKWERNEIGFHEPQGNRLLQSWWPLLALPAEARVLVPLCGKSVDLRWLRRRGHRVLGIELSERAVQAFFAEQGLRPEVRRQGGFKRWSADGIEILQGDIFDLEPEHLGEIDALYDRAALIALTAPQRQRYVELLQRCLGPGARGTLITLEYQPAESAGPPFSVSEGEVRLLFGRSFSPRTLVREDVLAENPKFRQRGHRSLHEVAYALLPVGEAGSRKQG